MVGVIKGFNFHALTTCDSGQLGDCRNLDALLQTPKCCKWPLKFLNCFHKENFSDPVAPFSRGLGLQEYEWVSASCWLLCINCSMVNCPGHPQSCSNYDSYNLCNLPLCCHCQSKGSLKEVMCGNFVVVCSFGKAGSAGCPLVSKTLLTQMEYGGGKTNLHEAGRSVFWRN